MQDSMTFLVTESLNEQRLDVALAAAAQMNRSQIRNHIENGLVLINGILSKKPGIKVFSGDTIQMTVPAIKSIELTPVDLKLDIVYEDECLAVVNKPSGLSVHPSDTETGPTMVHGLLHCLKSLSSVGGVARPGIVHRIDKGTSGLVVISKTDSCHSHLSAQFKDHTIDREYLALCWGRFREKQMPTKGTIKTLIGRNPQNRKKMTTKIKSGREAITHYEVLSEYMTSMSLVKCKLETGRTHQIRVHMSENAHPIVGDPTYGPANRQRTEPKVRKNTTLLKLLDQLDHQLLHARTLGFVHPESQKRLYFESELPEDFLQILKVLEENS